ncbi:rhodanese-like domain-containing protein [Clostridium sp. FP2]|uniref:rhodanese-like domain-containing protein n=1 Tax=Clostridium sp. FP2 TaxID=2724481 RepID=UPI0013E97ABB|nr:rhodanese-like domain-containing protein [Clostridium sp. FP2]MBZ9622631.1 rhodanese-like domain-containing protein [Clostridium sp. FP2]
MKKKFALLLTICIIMSSMLIGCAKSTASPKTEAQKKYQYYTADQLKTAIEKKAPMYLIDIQVEADYKAHHIVNTIPTYAYPADTAKLKSKIDVAFDKINATKDPIIVVCPGGGSGAKNTIGYLIDEKGIDASRLFILEKGQKGWPHDNLLEK